MVDVVKHLSTQVPIVRSDGTPTEYFARLLEDISDAKIAASVVDALGGDPDADMVVVWDDAAGDLVFLSLSDMLDWIDDTHGAILYRDSAGWAALAPGTDGDILTTHGAGADPAWESPAAPASDGGVFHMQDQRAASNDGGTFTAGAWTPRALNADVSNTITSAARVTSTVTITIASPGVVSWTAHGLVNGTQILLTTTGALPTGLTVGTVYYVVSAAANSFSLSATVGGAAINTSGSQSGTHTAHSSVFSLPAGTYDFFAIAPAHQVEGHQARLQNLTDATTSLLGTAQRSRQTSSSDGTNYSFVRGRITISGTKLFEIQHRCSATQATNGYGGASGVSWGTVVYTDVFIRKVS